ncbi:MAG: hypothetical protein RL367_780 [Pseudomonadota bacterium]|jgi:hypothetical protein
MNMHESISPAIDQQRIERVRAFVRSCVFVPMTDQECVTYRDGLKEGAHSNAIEGNPFDAEDWALFEMLIEEAAPAKVRKDAIFFNYELGKKARLAA